MYFSFYYNQNLSKNRYTYTFIVIKKIYYYRIIIKVIINTLHFSDFYKIGSSEAIRCDNK